MSLVVVGRVPIQRLNPPFNGRCALSTGRRAFYGALSTEDRSHLFLCAGELDCLTQSLGGALLQQVRHGGAVDQGRQTGRALDAAVVPANEVRLPLSVLAYNQDYSEAVKWYRMAAEQGDAMAQFSLGVMYYKGQGVPEDYVQAHMWVNLATSTSQGEQNEKFAKARKLIAEQMTSAQISDAQRLAREWKPKTWDELKKELTSR